MRRIIAMTLALTLGCRPAEPGVPSDSLAGVTALRDTLLMFGREDQAGRDSVGIAVARQDTIFLKRLMQSDSARMRWLQAAVATHGWPHGALMGDSAAKAAWLILQHSPDVSFQATMLPQLTMLAAKGEMPSADVAMLTDRVLSHQGKPQRYGTQFSQHADTLVADPISNLEALDSLRASVGLPTMTEYVKVLAEVYKVPVQWPPRRPQHD